MFLSRCIESREGYCNSGNPSPEPLTGPAAYSPPKSLQRYIYMTRIFAAQAAYGLTKDGKDVAGLVIRHPLHFTIW